MIRASALLLPTLLTIAACQEPMTPAIVGPEFSDSGPSLERYTEDGRYPRADRTNWFFKLSHNVDGFSRADGIWPSRTIARSETPSAWRRLPPPYLYYEGSMEVGRGR